MKVLLAWICSFFSMALFSQSIGKARIAELKQILAATESPIQKADLNVEIARIYRKFNTDSCSYFANQALKIARSQKLSKQQAQAYLMLAYTFSKSDYKKATAINAQSLAINKRIKSKSGAAQNYLLSGRIAQIQSDFVNASRYYFASVKLSNEANDPLTTVLNYQNLAFLFLDQQDIKKSLNYAFLAEALTKKHNITEEIGECAAIIAEIYRSDNKPDLSEKYFQSAYDFFKARHYQFGMASTLTNWSILYDGPNLPKSVEMQLEAQRIFDESDPENIMSIANQYNIAYTLIELCDKNDTATLSKIGMTYDEALRKALAYNKRSLAISKKNNNLHWVMNNTRLLATINYTNNDIKSYSKNLNYFYFIKDSLYSQENKNQIAALESKQKLDAKDKQIQLNKATLQSQEREKWLYISVILFMLVIAGLILTQSRNRKKNNEKLQQLNADLDHANKVKARFFSILNHDLRSPVSSLINFLHLQKESPDLLDAQSKKRMEHKTISAAENLLDSMEDLLLWSKGQMENFKPQPSKVQIALVFEDLQKHFSSVENVKLIFENPDGISVFTDENYVKTILRNLTGNAIKALEKTPNATVILHAAESEGKVKISVSDNGPGGTVEKFKALYDENEVVGIKTGLGLHLIRDLAKAIDCKIAVDTHIGSGTTFTISFQ